MLREFLFPAIGTAIGLLALATPVLANPFSFNQKLTTTALDAFGTSVALDENYALISKYEPLRSAYLFDATTGDLVHELINPNNVNGIRVDIDGDYALLGNSLFDTTTGNLLYELAAPDTLFDWSIALDGNYALIDNYLFDTTTGNFLHELTVPGPIGSVALNGDYAVISSQDSAYLFDIITGNILHELAVPGSYLSRIIKESVALNEEYILIGASSDGDVNSPGSAYLFDITSGNFLYELTPPNLIRLRSVALYENYALIGADVEVNNSNGVAYLFDTTTGNVLQRFTAPDAVAHRYDFFGYSVDINENYALIGAPYNYDNNNFTSNGAAYLFELISESDPNPVPEPASLLGLLAILGLGMSSALKRQK